MSNMGIVLDHIRERRVRAGYREPLPPREHMPPDLVEPCSRYPTAALLCFLAAVGGMIAVVVLMIALSVAASRGPKPAAAPKAVPGANGAGQAAGPLGR
jgi:hypothetical protein